MAGLVSLKRNKIFCCNNSLVLGDSGTRGTVDLLESFKVSMGDWRVRNTARDSRLFMRHYPVVYGKHIKYAGPTAYYAKGISSAHSLLYNKQTLEAAMGKRGVTHWFSGVQWAVETVGFACFITRAAVRILG